MAKTYSELRRFAEADSAYEKASPLVSLDVNALTDWADAHVMAKERKWDAEGRKIVTRALAADPKHVKALALAGSEAFDRADYKQAIDFWKRMKAAAGLRWKAMKWCEGAVRIGMAGSRAHRNKPRPS